MHSFSPIAYRIDKTDNFVNSDEKFIYGGFSKEDGLSNSLIQKIENGIKLFGSLKKECIPTYKNAFFVFLNDKSIYKFLYICCGLQPADINELKNAGYKLYKLEISCVSPGLSSTRGTCFMDEIENLEEIDFYNVTGY